MFKDGAAGGRCGAFAPTWPEPPFEEFVRSQAAMANALKNSKTCPALARGATRFAAGQALVNVLIPN